MRNYLNLLENQTSPFSIDSEFVTKVRDYIEEHLNDWHEDYLEDQKLIDTITQCWSLIEREGAPEGDHIEVYRAELRPEHQIADHDYGSLGSFWTWDIDSAGTLNHDNAYDEHGRDVREIIFVAEVKLHDIDWIQTIAKNMVLKREREITVKNGSVIHVEGVMEPHKYSYPHGEGFDIQVSSFQEF